MTVYLVRHELRQKEVEIDIHPKDEWKISRKDPDFLYSILRKYKKLTRYSGFINYRGLRFVKVSEPAPSKSSKEPAFAEPCDKDWCNACKKGDFNKCPNRH